MAVMTIATALSNAGLALILFGSATAKLVSPSPDAQVFVASALGSYDSGLIVAIFVVAGFILEGIAGSFLIFRSTRRAGLLLTGLLVSGWLVISLLSDSDACGCLGSGLLLSAEQHEALIVTALVLWTIACLGRRRLSCQASSSA